MRYHSGRHAAIGRVCFGGEHDAMKALKYIVAAIVWSCVTKARSHDQEEHNEGEVRVFVRGLHRGSVFAPYRSAQ